MLNIINFSKTPIVYFVLVLICMPVTSQELSKSQVVDIASSFWNIYKGRNEEISYRIKEYKRNDRIYLYLISKQERGSVVIANEQCLNGIIAYSDYILPEDSRDMPPAFNTLLELYMDVVDSVRNVLPSYQKRHRDMRTTRGMVVVNSLLEEAGNVSWNQIGNNSSYFTDPYHCDYYHNKFAPAFDIDLPCGKGHAGCTAVAMAQILWYWKWPDYAWIKPTINRITGTTYGTPSKHYYDWQNMPPFIYNNSSMYQVDAVAGLLRDCEYAAHTKYWAEGSAALVGDARRALRDTFDFHVTDTHEYSWTEINPILDLSVILQAKKNVV